MRTPKSEHAHNWAQKFKNACARWHSTDLRGHDDPWTRRTRTALTGTERENYFLPFSFTMVIKQSPRLGGESAGGDRSSRMSKCSAGVYSDLGNGSFWIKIRDAKAE